MFHNNPLLMQLKKKINANMPRIEGIVKSSDKGFGFLEVDSQKSYFIPPKKMTKVMHGDRITAILKHECNRTIVEPEKLIEPFLKKFVGMIKKKNDQLFIVPDYPLINILIKCHQKNYLIDKYKHGDWVIAKLTQHRLNGDQFFFAELIDLIITKNDNFYPWLVTLASYNLQHQAPSILDSKELHFDNSHTRKDLTSLDFITIDSIDTQDIDDAVFIKDNGQDILTVMVAIADPSAYILHDSRLDQIARERAFTNYLPGFKIPMLPYELSENICSLLPDKRRPVLVCQFNTLLNGEIIDSSISFFLGWIKSKEKLVYEHVSNWLEKSGKWAPSSGCITKQLILLHKFCKNRMLWRKKHALIFKEKLEYKFCFNSDQTIKKIIIEVRRIAHRMIEETMIAANVCAAKFLSKNLGYGIFNIHKGITDISHIEQAIILLSKFNINCTSEDVKSLTGFCKIHRELNSISNEYLHFRIRRYQSFGEVCLYPGPHYSLGFDQYATWTSPIRKYSDIINHRLIKSIITGTKSLTLSNELLIHISERKRKYRLVQRDVEDWLYVLYLNQNFNNELFNAEIIDVYKGGIRVKLIKNGANIFIPASLFDYKKEDLYFDKDNGLIHLKTVVICKVSDIIKVHLYEIKTLTRHIIAKPILLYRSSENI
ncbi:MAG: exoribonuclease II [Buchnera aphidicola (Eriosoma harunire)]